MNPERAKHLRIKEERAIEAPLQKSIDDPVEISKAIDDLAVYSAAVDADKWTALGGPRNALNRALRLEANERVATHKKTPLILEKMESVDRRLAEKMGSFGEPLLQVSRERELHVDALGVLDEAFKACKKLGTVKTKADVGDIVQKIENAFTKSAALDPRSARYSGMSKSGGVVDVPFEQALCRFRIQNTQADIEDQEPPFPDLSSPYVGCGEFELLVVSKQDEKGGFGPYFLTTKAAFSDEPGELSRIECGAIPPLSDAPKDIIDLVKSNVQWLKPNDILSLKGDYKYEDGEAGMRKLGRVALYRRDANLKTNPCGAKDDIITCSRMGNEVTLAYDLGLHYSERAKIHRAHARVDRCQMMAKKALAMTSQKVNYDGKLIYQTNKNNRFQPSEIKAKIEAMKTETSAMLSSSWCDRNSNQK